MMDIFEKADPVGFMCHVISIIYIYVCVCSAISFITIFNHYHESDDVHINALTPEFATPVYCSSTDTKTHSSSLTAVLGGSGCHW